MAGTAAGAPATDVLNRTADSALTGDRSTLGTTNLVELRAPVDLGMPATTLPGHGDGAQRTEFRWLMESDVCKHCTHAACLDVCPTGSLFRTEFGTVVVQDDICNGCGYCVPACPFGVIDRRVGEKGVTKNEGIAQKCTLCYDRLGDGLQPACATACPTQSIQYGDVDELRERAQKRVDALHEAGVHDARLYGENTARRRRRARGVLPAARRARGVRAAAGPGRHDQGPAGDVAQGRARGGRHAGRSGRGVRRRAPVSVRRARGRHERAQHRHPQRPGRAAGRRAGGDRPGRRPAAQEGRQERRRPRRGVHLLLRPPDRQGLAVGARHPGVPVHGRGRGGLVAARGRRRPHRPARAAPHRPGRRARRAVAEHGRAGARPRPAGPLPPHAPRGQADLADVGGHLDPHRVRPLRRARRRRGAARPAPARPARRRRRPAARPVGPAGRAGGRGRRAGGRLVHRGAAVRHRDADLARLPPAPAVRLRRLGVGGLRRARHARLARVRGRPGPAAGRRRGACSSSRSSSAWRRPWGSRPSRCTRATRAR